MLFKLTQAVAGTTLVVWDHAGVTVATINDASPFYVFTPDIYASCQPRLVDLVRGGSLIQSEIEESVAGSGSCYEQVAVATGQVCAALAHIPVLSDEAIWVWVDKVPVLHGTGLENFDIVKSTGVITFGASVDLVGKTITVKYYA